MNQRDDEILTLEDAARFAKTSKNTIRAIILSGRLQAVEIGKGGKRRHYRILKSDLLRFFGIKSGNAEAEQPGTDGRTPTPFQKQARL